MLELKLLEIDIKYLLFMFLLDYSEHEKQRNVRKIKKKECGIIENFAMEGS